VEPDKQQSRKIRVAFHKNRGKRKRVSDLTRQSELDEDATTDLPQSERLSGKGDLTRHRTISVSHDEPDQTRRQLLAAGMQPGRVLTAIGANQCRVQADDGQVMTCSVRRAVRTRSREQRNAVIAGDRVIFSLQDAHSGVIEFIEPRRSTLSRGSRLKAHVIVANVDQAVIVASVSDPPLKLGLIDRFLCSIEKGGIRGLICINKIDLSDRPALQPIAGQYARLGYPVILTNALTGDGIPELRRLLRGKETVFTGQSGVGKTSLLNAIQPGLGRRTGEVSPDTSKGRHTTRVTELISLEAGGWVVDTPGIRTLQLWDVAPSEVEGLFVEFRPFVTGCRFPNCSHIHEQICGVKSALSEGFLSPLRYENYVRIVTGDHEG